MIGDADTKAPAPQSPSWVDGYAKGVVLETELSIRVTGFGYIFEEFNDLDNWVPVYGKLSVSGGSTSDVYGPLIGSAAARHKTQLLTDNCRAKVTIQDGIIAWGESRVFICADERMNSYYGMTLVNDGTGAKVGIIRGKSSTSADVFELTAVTLVAGDEFEVWFDRPNGVVRVYQNASEICSKDFGINDIPHGPGSRYVGVIMSVRWLLDQGPRFDDFTATDVPYAEPVIHDPIDSLEPNPKWVEVLNGIKVNRHLLFPPTLGPDNVFYTSAAARWEDPMGTDSVKAVFTSLRIASGQFRVAVRSNAAMTNWVGVEFNTITNKVRAIKGTGPTTIAYYSTEPLWVDVAQQYTITWNDATKTLKLYRGAKKTPILSWATGAAFTGTGRYFGLSWTTALLAAGVEPLAIDVYDVTADNPLPL